VDNHDSFVFNLVQYLAELGADCTVLDRDDVTVRQARDMAGVLLSPGPGHPAGSGVCLDLVHDALARGRPLLGVCLGHQAIAVALGGTVDHAPEVVHGYAHPVHHTGQGLLAGVPSPFQATRYHSLAITALPPELEVTARTPDEVIMGVRHRTAPIEGVQFHPESVLSEHGHRMLGTWLAAL
jgi:para-aminobenzoate synthetase component 2